MNKIELKNVCKTFDQTQVLKSIDLEIQKGEFVVFVGPSGCGKSTLLRVISGLEDVTTGELSIDGKNVNSVPPAKRGLAMVFQSYALYPHMSVYRNIAFPLKMAGIAHKVIDKKVKEVAETLNLTAYMHRRPGQLSGGQRQRVAIGRAIVREPVAFLFDEPLSNLDAALRVSMRIEISELHKKLKTTMIYVTHDQVEAMTMADRIVVLSDGVVEQIGTPTELYTNPTNIFIAGFIGSPKMNLVSGKSAEKLKAKTIGIRPEHLKISDKKGMWKGKTGVCENLGSDVFLHVHIADSEDMVVRLPGEKTVPYGKTIYLTPDLKRIHRFDENGISMAKNKKSATKKSASPKKSVKKSTSRGAAVKTKE